MSKHNVTVIRKDSSQWKDITFSHITRKIYHVDGKPHIKYNGGLVPVVQDTFNNEPIIGKYELTVWY